MSCDACIAAVRARTFAYDYARSVSVYCVVARPANEHNVSGPFTAECFVMPMMQDDAGSQVAMLTTSGATLTSKIFKRVQVRRVRMHHFLNPGNSGRFDVSPTSYRPSPSLSFHAGAVPLIFRSRRLHDRQVRVHLY